MLAAFLFSRLGTGFLYNILKIRCSHFYLHIAGASSPLLSGPLAMLPPILDSPVRLSDNNNPQHSPVMPFGTRAMTLPEISGMNMIDEVTKKVGCHLMKYYVNYSDHVLLFV